MLLLLLPPPTHINLDDSKEGTGYRSPPAALKLVVGLRTSNEVESVVLDAVVKSNIGVFGGGIAESRLVVLSAE